ncbi:hypothetical protein KKF81_02375 [Candidatus Micrarchaeota archaeon]|nr:hypothetical protein [Candidatus Micrarchaeota archaeon]
MGKKLIFQEMLPPAIIDIKSRKVWTALPATPLYDLYHQYDKSGDTRRLNPLVHFCKEFDQSPYLASIFHPLLATHAAMGALSQAKCRMAIWEKFHNESTGPSCIEELVNTSMRTRIWAHSVTFTVGMIIGASQELMGLAIGGFDGDIVGSVKRMSVYAVSTLIFSSPILRIIIRIREEIEKYKNKE